MADGGKLSILAELVPDPAALKSFGTQLTATATKGANSIKRILSGALGAAFLSSAVNGTKEFEQSLRQVDVLTDNVDLKTLKQQAEGLSETLGGSATDAVNAYYQAVSAGFEDSGAATTLTRTAAGLAAIGSASGEMGTTKDSMNLITTAINAYGLSAEDASKVSDTLFRTIKYGKTTASELAQSFSTAAPMAAGLGISMEDLLGTTSALTQMGFQTSKAFVGIRQIMSEAAKPTSDVGKAIKENLGMSFLDATQKGMSLTEILRDGIIPSLQNGTPELINYFKNVRGGSTAMALANDNFALVNKTIDKFTSNVGISGKALEKFKNNQATTFASSLNHIKDIIMNVIEGVGGLGNAVAILGTVFALFKLGNFIARCAEAVAALSGVAVAKAAAQSGVGAIAAVPAVLAAIGAGLGAAGAFAGLGMFLRGGSSNTPSSSSSDGKKTAFHVTVNNSNDGVTGDSSTSVTMHQNDNIKNAYGASQGE